MNPFSIPPATPPVPTSRARQGPVKIPARRVEFQPHLSLPLPLSFEAYRERRVGCLSGGATEGESDSRSPSASASTFTLALTFLHFPRAREHERDRRPFRGRYADIPSASASEILANEAACAGLSGKLVLGTAGGLD